MTAPEPHDLTDAEDTLAHTYAKFLDVTAQVARAVEQGDWLLVADLTCQLRTRARAFEAAADVVAAADPPPRPDAVMAAIGDGDDEYGAARMLHREAIDAAAFARAGEYVRTVRTFRVYDPQAPGAIKLWRPPPTDPGTEPGR